MSAIYSIQDLKHKLMCDCSRTTILPLNTLQRNSEGFFYGGNRFFIFC